VLCALMWLLGTCVTCAFIACVVVVHGLHSVHMYVDTLT